VDKSKAKICYEIEIPVNRQYRHPEKLGKAAISDSLSDELRKRTWRSMQRQAGLRGSAR